MGHTSRTGKWYLSLSKWRLGYKVERLGEEPASLSFGIEHAHLLY